MAAPSVGMAVPQFPAVGLMEGVACANAGPTATVDTGTDTGAHTDTGTGNSIGSCGARTTTGPAPPPAGFWPPVLGGVPPAPAPAGGHLDGLNGQTLSMGSFPGVGVGMGNCAGSTF